MAEAKVTCDKMVHGQRASFPCTEEEAHEGPCATPDVPKSMTNRQNWANAVATLGTVQSPAESMREQAERLARGHAEPQGSPDMAGETQPIVQRTVGDEGPHSDNVTPMVDPMAERQPQVVTGKATGTILGKSKDRPGDQPMPTIDADAPEVSAQDAFIAFIEERKALGEERYGTLLFPFNGRNTLQDAYEEVADAGVYLAGLKMEREVLIGRVVQAAQTLHGPLFGEGDTTITKGDLTNVYGFLADLALWLGYDPGALEAPGPDSPT